MSKKALYLLVVILIVGLVFVQIIRRPAKTNDNPASSPQANNSCLSVSIEYKSQCNQLNSWLDQKLVEWKPQALRPMMFGSRLGMASYSDPSFMTNNYDIVLKDLEVQNETGADIMTIEWYYSLDTLDKNKALLESYDKLIGEIRKKGKKVMIADTAEESDLSWNNWKGKYKSQVEFLAKRWKPDYYVVVFEPDNYMGRFATTPVKARFTDPKSATT